MKYLLPLSLWLAILVGCQTPATVVQTPTSTSTQMAALATAVLSTPAPMTTPLPTNTAVPPSPLPSATATPLPSPTPTPDYPLYSGPPLQRAQMGVQIHLRDEDLDLIFAHLDTLSLGWVKVQISWKLYQPFPDQYEMDRLAELDAFINRANEQGIAVLLGVAKAPEWSRPTTELDGPPSDYTHYRDFMQMLATRYRGQVAAYELWNEMNLQREWNGVPLQATDFVRLVVLGAEGVRLADPTAILISGAPAPTGINDGITAVDDRVYLRQMLEAGILDVVDALGAHPYGWANPPDTTSAMPDPTIPSHNDHPSFFFLNTIQDYRALLDEFGYEAVPIWVTEFGWGSFEGFGDVPPAGVEFMMAVSEWQQAVYTLRAYEMAQENLGLGPMLLWNLNFGPLLGDAYSESGFSLLRRDGSPRPIYKALAAANKEG